MQTYFDTSLLLKSYIPEQGTKRALEIIHTAQPPFPFSHLLELEIRTAMRLKFGRGELTKAQLTGALRAVESDFSKGILLRPKYDLEEVFSRAESISRDLAANTMARSADIWHIAAAIEIQCARFASFDQRQREVAEMCGLTVIPEPCT